MHRASVVSMHIQTFNGSQSGHSLIVSRCYTFYMHGLMGTVLVLIVDEGSLALSYARIHFHVLFMYVLVSSPFNPSFLPPIQTLLLYVWWEAPPLTVVVWRCSTMERGVQCVMIPGTSMMQL